MVALVVLVSVSIGASGAQIGLVVVISNLADGFRAKVMSHKCFLCLGVPTVAGLSVQTNVFLHAIVGHYSIFKISILQSSTVLPF